jgi:hypothetical protein
MEQTAKQTRAVQDEMLRRIADDVKESNLSSLQSLSFSSCLDATHMNVCVC